MALTLLNLSEARAAGVPLKPENGLNGAPPLHGAPALDGAPVTTKRAVDPTMGMPVGAGTMGGFQAARINRLTGDWAAWSRSADQELFTDLRILRARARQLALNNPLAARYLQLLRQNIVGPEGILFASKIEAPEEKAKRKKKPATVAAVNPDGTPKVNPDGTPAMVPVTEPLPVPVQTGPINGSNVDAINEAIETAWFDWCKLGNCTVGGKQTWTELLNQIVETMGREGEVVIRKVHGSQYKNGFALQLLDNDQLDDTMLQLRPGPGGNEVRLGVEVDGLGKPVAYYLWDGNPYESFSATVNKKRIPAEQVLHVYIQHRAGQSRGYPWIAPAMFDVKMLDGYLEAEVLAARVGANQCMLLESDLGDDYIGAGDGPDGSGYQNVGGTTQMNLEPATINTLPPGTKAVAFKPEHPAGAFPAFLKSVIRFIASGLGVAYTTLSNDLEGVSYSSARVGMLDERDHWSTLQRFVIDHVCVPVFEEWLRSALLRGQLKGVPLNFDLVNQAKWEGRSWDWVDPHKDAQGQVLAIQNGLTTHTKALAEQGMDFEATMKQLAKEKAYITKLGLKLGTDAQGKADSEVNNAEPFAVPNPGKPPTGPGGGEGADDQAYTSGKKTAPPGE